MPPKARQYVYRPKRDNYSAICRCSRGFGNRQSKLNCTNRAHASPTPTGRPRKRARSELSSGRHLEGVSLDNEPAVIDDTITDFLFDRGILSGAGPALKFGRDHAPGDGRELSLEDIVDLLYNQSITLESAVTRMLDRVFPEEADRARAAVQSYMAMFEPSSAFELAFTDRYAVTQMLRESLIDGKLGLTVLARRDFAEGEIIPGLDGPVFPHDPNLHNDFSTFYDTSRQREMGLCGPARLVNHDCNNNVRFVRLEGGRIGFRATRPIANGEEILTTYGPSSFGANNVGCCCQTCELANKGAYEGLNKFGLSDLIRRREKLWPGADDMDLTFTTPPTAFPAPATAGGGPLPTVDLSVPSDLEVKAALMVDESNLAPELRALPMTAPSPASYALL